MRVRKMTLTKIAIRKARGLPSETKFGGGIMRCMTIVFTFLGFCVQTECISILTEA
jgi:hypothetical protein